MEARSGVFPEIEERSQSSLSQQGSSRVAVYDEVQSRGERRELELVSLSKSRKRRRVAIQARNELPVSARTRWSRRGQEQQEADLRYSKQIPLRRAESTASPPSNLHQSILLRGPLSATTVRPKRRIRFFRLASSMETSSS